VALAQDFRLMIYNKSWDPINSLKTFLRFVFRYAMIKASNGSSLAHKIIVVQYFKHS